MKQKKRATPASGHLRADDIREAAPSAPLGQSDFVPLSMAGYGDPWNAYTHGMNFFEGKLYCGTFRGNLCLKSRAKVGRPEWDPWPIKCPPGDAFKELDLRAQIWQFDPRTASWKNVHRAPIVVGRNGQDMPRECAYRGIMVFQGKSDHKPVMYVTPFSNTNSTGPVILRSEDGNTFLPCTRPGIGLDGVSSFRFLVSFKGRVFTSPVGSNNNIVNESRYPTVYCSEDPARDVWQRASEPNFGDPDNSVIFNMAAMGDYLYAGTFNAVTGFQLWKSLAEGEPPFHWEKVLDSGAYRGNFNEGVLSMQAFNGALYIGTCIQDGGFDRVNKVGPAAGEVLRVFPDDSWELLVGAARLTPQGVKVPKSGLGPGFGDFFNGYIWRMAVHENRLYVGTVNWATYLRYIVFDKWPKKLRSLIETWGTEEIIGRSGGFDLWCTEDGCNFTPVTRSGFGNPYNVGVRTLVSTPYGLACGSVNVFGPTVAVRTGAGVEYIPNPRGGTEVWLGATSHSERILSMRPLGAPEGGPNTAAGYRLSSVDVARRQRPPARPLDMIERELRSRMIRVDLDGAAGDVLRDGREQFGLQVEGLEHLPETGAALIVGNNPEVPLLVSGMIVPAHALYTLDAIARYRTWPGWFFAPTAYFTAAHWGHSADIVLEQLGFVPAVPVNGVRLLRMGQAVVIYPEAKASLPPYQMRPFTRDFIDIAYEAGAPIVPVAFVGPHESHLLIEHSDRQVLVNKKKPLRTSYVIRFLPPVHVRRRLGKVPDGTSVAALAEEIRSTIQDAVDRETAKRPFVRFARYLQRQHGSTPRPKPETPRKGDAS